MLLMRKGTARKSGPVSCVPDNRTQEVGGCAASQTHDALATAP